MGTAGPSLISLIVVELERGRDVTIIVKPTADGNRGRLKMPDGWESFVLAGNNR